MQAVRINDIGSIEQLLESNSSPDYNKKDKHGYTPLHYAAKFNRSRIFELLLTKGKAGICASIRTYSIQNNYYYNCNLKIPLPQL